MPADHAQSPDDPRPRQPAQAKRRYARQAPEGANRTDAAGVTAHLLCEMFPNRIRAAALGLGAELQSVANFVVSATFPTLKNVGLGYAYGLYAVAAVLSFFFVLALIRETRGKELETMTESMRQPESASEGLQRAPFLTCFAASASADFTALRLRAQKYVVLYDFLTIP
jgi:hypothetical protein